jgi:DNA-binding CsgD family transcriptional regulator
MSTNSNWDRAALSVATTAYDLEQPLDGWIRAVTEAARPILDAGLGVLGTTFELVNGTLRIAPAMVKIGEVPDPAEQVIRRMAASLSPSELDHTFGHPKALDTASGCYSRMAPDQRFAEWPLMAEFRNAGVVDCMAAKSCDPTGAGMIFLAPLPNEVRVPAVRARHWERSMAHLLASLRLRRSLDGSQEAVLDLGGRLHHAEGLAQGKSAMAALRAAARRVDYTRSTKGHANPRAALESFRALVAGRWSLVDSFESDGRHFLIARRNDPRIAEPRALSQRERQIVAYAASGHSNKYIAYALGLAPSTVSTHLVSAMRRLGLKRRAELAALWSLTSDET